MWGFSCTNTGLSEAFEEMTPLGGPPREPYVTQSEAVFATKEEAEEAARRHIAADPLHDESSEVRLLELIIEGTTKEPVGKKKVEAFEPEPAKKAAKKRKKTTKKKRKKTTKKKGSTK